MKIQWQSPGSDVVHNIPEHAKVTFCFEDGTKVSFQIKRLHGTEYLERDSIKGEPEIIDRRVGPPDRRE